VSSYDSKKVILYARVSTQEQADKGYSLAQQLEAVRICAVSQGYEVLEEVTDAGLSGATLERPGLNRVRELVEAGEVSAVLAQDRDRFAREPAYHYLLKKEFEEHGTKLRSLNDRGDDSPEGQFTDDVLDVMAKFERRKTAQRTTRGRLQRAKEGKVVPSASPPYGYAYNADRTNYVVEEARMALVRRIFDMMAKGFTMHGVQRTFEREGLLSPNGHKHWNTRFIRDLINNDVYRSHGPAEIEALVSEGRMGAEVAARLDDGQLYGIWYYGRLRVAQTPTSGRKRKYTQRDASEWVAVAIPDAGIPAEDIATAREAIKNNRPHSRAGDRYWELSGCVAYCACGRVLKAITRRKPKGDYNYYVCPNRRGSGRGDVCEHAKHHRAEPLEQKVRDYVSDLLRNPERLQDQIEATIERERELSREPGREAKKWREKIEQAERMRSAYQDQQAAGLMTLEELGEKLGQLDEVCETARLEIKAVTDCLERIEELERDKANVLQFYAGGMMRRGLEIHSPEERREIYRRLKLEAVVYETGDTEIVGSFDSDLLPVDENTVRKGADRWFEQGRHLLHEKLRRLRDGSGGGRFLPSSTHSEVWQGDDQEARCPECSGASSERSVDSTRRRWTLGSQTSRLEPPSSLTTASPPSLET
jgi:site-specific DNA recombinase